MPKTKQQMQIILVGVVVGCGAVFAIIYFGVSPLLSGWKANLAQIKEIRAELDDAKTVIRNRPDIEKKIDEVRESIRHISKQHIQESQLGNYLLEMEETIHACVGDTDVEIIDIIDNDILELEGGSDLFKAYRVRVTAIAGVHDLVKVFYNIETRYPYVSISGLMILPRKEDPEHHNVSFTVAWLIWSDPEKRPAFLLESRE